MFEKLRGFFDLKGLLMAGSLIAGLVTTYNTVGLHTDQINAMQSTVQTNYSQTLEHDKDLSRLNYRVGSIETRQNATDEKFEELNKSINKLNETLIRLSTILEGNRSSNRK